jgi:DNA-binding NtrC family response regulator
MMDKEKILVVDDEHLIRWTLEQHLKKEGYEVVTAESGEKALELLPDVMPHCATRQPLPGMMGIDVLGR